MACIFYVKRLKTQVPKGYRLPPGPSGQFILGNIRDLRRRKVWEILDLWSQQYGDLVYINALGTSILLVNSHDLARELFEKRGAIYSDRYQSTMFKLVGFDWTVKVLQYGDLWRRHRSGFYPLTSNARISKYEEIQYKHSRNLLTRLLHTPNEFLDHVRRSLGEMVLETTYGIEALPEKDPYLELSEELVIKLGETGIPGNYLVDVIPLLRFIPAWFPGATFQRDVQRFRGLADKVLNLPFDTVRNNMKTGTARSSVLFDLLSDFDSEEAGPDQEGIIRSNAGSVYMASVDSTDAAIRVFFLAMALYPETQRIAQHEIDQTIGKEAFPTFEDRQRLPYVQALCKEVMRWRPVTPIAVPHVLRQDDFIGDYFVPKGTVVIGNTWSLLHKKSVFGHDADKFRPERFLNSGFKSFDAAFGYGKRVCPGKLFAEKTLFIMISHILQSFSISPLQNGQTLDPDNFDFGLILRPSPFECKIVPRSETLFKGLAEVGVTDS